MVTPSARRRAAGYLAKEWGLSQRKAAKVMGTCRGTLRYTPRAGKDDEALAALMKRLAYRHPRYGLRRIEALLRREGIRDNRKRLHRLWKAEGLGLRRTRRRRRKREPGEVWRKAEYPDHVWSYDFMEARTVHGGKMRILNVLDEYTREYLWVRLERSMPAAKVVEVLEWLFITRGRPEYLRSDNGGEFVAKAVKEWLSANGVGTIYIEPGSPWENAYVESFNGKFRDECLNANEFEGVRDAQEIANEWRREYNEYRPHSSLGYRTPSEFAAEAARSPRATPSAPLQPEDCSKVTLHLV
jgi:transposase InsO family protein